MASQWALTEDLFPRFRGDETVPEQIRALVDYMYVLSEQLQYTLSNLKAENWNDAAISSLVQKPLTQMRVALEVLQSTDSAVTLGSPDKEIRIVGKAVYVNDTLIGGEENETA